MCFFPSRVSYSDILSFPVSIGGLVVKDARRVFDEIVNDILKLQNISGRAIRIHPVHMLVRPGYPRLPRRIQKHLKS